MSAINGRFFHVDSRYGAVAGKITTDEAGRATLLAIYGSDDPVVIELSEASPEALDEAFAQAKTILRQRVQARADQTPS